MKRRQFLGRVGAGAAAITFAPTIFAKPVPEVEDRAADNSIIYHMQTAIDDLERAGGDRKDYVFLVSEGTRHRLQSELEADLRYTMPLPEGVRSRMALMVIVASVPVMVDSTISDDEAELVHWDQLPGWQQEKVVSERW